MEPVSRPGAGYSTSLASEALTPNKTINSDTAEKIVGHENRSTRTHHIICLYD